MSSAYNEIMGNILAAEAQNNATQQKQINPIETTKTAPAPNALKLQAQKEARLGKLQAISAPKLTPQQQEQQAAYEKYNTAIKQRDSLLKEQDSIEAQLREITNRANVTGKGVTFANTDDEAEYKRLEQRKEEIADSLANVDTPSRTGAAIKQTAGSLGNAVLTAVQLAGKGASYSYSAEEAIRDTVMGINPADTIAEKKAYFTDNSDLENAKGEMRGMINDAGTQLQAIKDNSDMFGAFLTDAYVTGLNIAADTAVSLVTGGVGGSVSMGLRVFGQVAAESADKGDSLEKQAAKGLTAAAIELITEAAGGAFAKVYGKLGGKKLGEATARAVDRFIRTDSGRIFATFLKETAEEGAQEALSDYLNILADHAFGWAEEGKSIEDDLKENKEQIIYDALLGAFVGAFGAGGNAIKAGRGGNANANTANSIESASTQSNAPTSEIDNLINAATQQAPQRAQESAQAITQQQTQPTQQTEPTSETAQFNSNTEAQNSAPTQNVQSAGTENATAAAIQRRGGTEETHISNRTMGNVGDRTVNAFQFDNPEIKPFYQQAAKVLQDDLALSTSYNAPQLHQTFSNKTIDRIMGEMSRNEAIDALQRIIDDSGLENAANAKRLEIILDDMLTHGYTPLNSDVARMPVNNDYIAARENVKGGTGNADEYRIQAAIETEIEAALWDGEELSEEDARKRVMQRYEETGYYSDADELRQREVGSNEDVETENADEYEGEDYSDEYGYEEYGEDENEPVYYETADKGEEYSITEKPAAEKKTANDNANAVPTQPAQGNGEFYERGGSREARTDANTDEAIRKEFTDSPEMYARLSNKETLAKAQEIYNQDFDEAKALLEQALGAAKHGMKLSPEMVPLSKMVTNELARRGNIKEARRIKAEVFVELTLAGQLGQANIIMRNSDPEAVKITIQKAIDRINNGLSPKQRTQWTAKLTEEEIALIDQTGFTEEGAFEAVYDQIAHRLGQEMPSSLWEKIVEIRRVGMLLRPRTQIKNYVANMPMLALRKAAETLSGGIQDALVKSGAMAEADRTRTLNVSAKSKMLANQFFAENKDSLLNNSNKWDMNSALRQYRTYFNKGPMSALVEGITGKELQMSVMDSMRNFTYEWLEKGDATFVKSAFIDSLAQYCEAKGITSADGITEDAIAFATVNAMEATFKSASATAQYINKLKKIPGVGAAVEIIFPFTTTPINITKQLIKYSPVGFVNTIRQALRGASAVEKADSASRATVGTIALALGMMLRSFGWITGGADDDKDKAAWDKANGISPYSIAGRVSYDWAEPIGSMVAVGADIMNAIQGNETWTDAFLNAIYTAGDAVLELSIFQNVASLLKGYGKGATQSLIDTIIESGATQIIPGIAGDIAKIIDSDVRSTYTGGNVLQTTGARIAANIPGLSFMLPESRDVRGDAVSRGGFLTRVFNTLVNPATMNINKKTEADREIERVYDATGNTSIFPQVAPNNFSVTVDGEQTKYILDGEEKSQFQQTMGEYYYTALNKLLESKTWNRMSDKAKADAMTNLANQAKYEAERELVANRGGEYKADGKDYISSLKKPEEYIALSSEYRIAEKSKDYKEVDNILRNYGSLPVETRNAMAEHSDTFRALAELKSDGLSSSKSYFEAREQTSADRKSAKAAGESYGGIAEARSIASSVKNTSDIDILIANALGKAQNEFYSTARENGLSPQETLDLYESVDKDMDGVEQAELYAEYLAHPEMASVIIAIWNAHGYKKSFDDYARSQR